MIVLIATRLIRDARVSTGANTVALKGLTRRLDPIPSASIAAMSVPPCSPDFALSNDSAIGVSVCIWLVE